MKRKDEEEEIIKWIKRFEEEEKEVQRELVRLRQILFYFRDLLKDEEKEMLLSKIRIYKKTDIWIKKRKEKYLKVLQYLRISKVI